jgi:predicted dehydrogenase
MSNLQNAQSSKASRFFDDPQANQQRAAQHQTPASLGQHRLAIIGCGMIGREHMRVATLLGRARVHGIYDTNVQSMAEAEAEFAKYSPETLVRYPDLQAACTDAAVDALMICTPNFTHYDVFKQAVKSRKPLFIEKPMATTLADAAAMLNTAENYPALVQIGLQYRYKPQYTAAFHAVLAEQRLGPVKTVSISEYRPPFLDKVEQWNKFNVNSGGTLVEKCCNYFYLNNLRAEARPRRVYASGGQAVNFLDFEQDGQPSDIDDHAFVIIDYHNGVRANFTLNMFCADLHEEMIITGERGRVVATEYSSFRSGLPSSAQIAVELVDEPPSQPTDVTFASHIEQSGHHGATFFEHDAFIDQLEGKAADAATLRQGMWSIIVASAAQQSMASGEAVDVDELIATHNLATTLGD